MRKFLQFISIIFHPVLILALMMLLSLWISFAHTPDFWKWLILGFGLIYGVPGTYYVYLIFSQKTDYDVKDRPSREAMLKVSILTVAAAFVLSLFLTDTEMLQKILLAGVASSLIYVIIINLFNFEISVHVGSLTVLIIFLTHYLSPYYLIGAALLVVVAVSRYYLKKHSLAELLGGLIITGGIYWLILKV